MKKILLAALVIFACVFFIVRWGQAEKPAELSNEEKYLVELVELSQKAESYQDVYFILEKSDSELMQMELSKVDNPIVQLALLNYENLSANALVNMCENPHKDLNLKTPEIKESFISAITKTDLDKEQELRIAKVKEYAMQIGILSREKISAETLIQVLTLNNNEFNWVINLENEEVKQHIYNHILKVSLTSKQEKQLKNMNISYVSHALEAR